MDLSQLVPCTFAEASQYYYYPSLLSGSVDVGLSFPSNHANGVIVVAIVVPVVAAVVLLLVVGVVIVGVVVYIKRKRTSRFIPAIVNKQDTDQADEEKMDLSDS